MNRTKIEWCNFSWNPVTGCPEPHCWYCYAKKMYRRFPKLGNPDFLPKYFPERLQELRTVKKPSRIFVGSCTDLFAKEVPGQWRQDIWDEMKLAPQHTYLILTKRPQNINVKDLGENVWVGTTINNELEIGKAQELSNKYFGNKFISFEPLLGEIQKTSLQIALCAVDWVIVGRITGAKKVPIKDEWIQRIITCANYAGVPVFVKNNVEWKEKIQEYPKKMGAIL
jgi:protein gp37